MDAKALAKSKRAHSLQHSKKHHSNPTSKAASASSGGESSAKKPSRKQVQPHHSQGSSALPTNWDRYEEEYGPDSEDPSQNKISQATDIVVPKSKGADYAYLISEAKSQTQTHTSLESFPSFDDVLSDFYQEFGSMLSERGQGILSWAADDNFVVDDRTTSNQEASFLSLNLHHLAEQLAKVDLSQRLFIEADLLPPELSTEDLETSFSTESDKVQAASQIEGVNKNSDHLIVRRDSDGDKMKDQTTAIFPSDSSITYHSVSAPSYQGLKSSNQAKDEVSQSAGTHESPVQYLAQIDGPSVAKPKKNASRFEATAAEAELDMLLDSFNETEFLDSPSVSKKSSATFPIEQEKSSSRAEGTLKQAPPQPLGEAHKSSGSALLANSFDDTLDDLLNETSACSTNPVQQEETILFQPLRKGPDTSKSTMLTANFDDDLDDLPKETSNPTNPMGSSKSSGLTSSQLNTMPSASTGPPSKSKALDDFDSWFDTL
ncbi:hypothetical protein NMG60_11032829 [Bertholletia excelsa]